MLLLPLLMSLQEESFDFVLICATRYFFIPYSSCKIGSGVHIGMGLQSAYLTAKRLLIGPIGAIHKVAATAFLRGIGALDPGGPYPALGSIPGDLLGQVREVRGMQVGVHGPRLELHGPDRQLLIGKPRVGMFRKALVDGAVDLLAHVTSKALPTFAAG